MEGEIKIRYKFLIWILVTVLLAAAVAAATDFSEGMVACYNFDTDTTSITGDNDLTLGAASSISAVQSKLGGKALYCGGGASADVKAYTDSAVNLSIARSFSGWIYVAVGGGDDMAFSFGNGGDYIRSYGGNANVMSIVNGVGGDTAWSQTNGLAAGWTHFVLNFGDNNQFEFWENGAMTDNQSGNSNRMDTDWTKIYLCNWQGGSHADYSTPLWYFDEVLLSGKYLTAAEITELYNGGTGLDACTAAGSDPTGGPNVTINLPVDNYITNVSDLTIEYALNSTNSSLDKCYYYLNNVLTTTNTTPQNNTDNFFYDDLADGYYNLSVNCTDVNGYVDRKEVLNITVDTTYPSQVNDFAPYYTFNQILNINFTDLYEIRNVSIIDNCNISYVNTSIGRELYNYTYSSLVTNCSIGSYSTTLNYCDYAGNCNQDVYTWDNLGRLNITVRYARDNSTILNYTVLIDDVYNGNTTSGGYLLDNLTGHLNISVDAPGFELGSVLHNITKTFEYLNFTLYGTNSLLIYIYDEVLDTLVTDNITIDFSGADGTSWTNISTTGEIYLENINSTEYTIQFYNDLYALRTYIVTVGDRTSQTLNAYMINKTYNTIFTVIDKDTDSVIDGVSFGVYRQKGGVWSLITNPVTDITGKVKFYYDPIANYRFYLNKPGYDDLIFYLNPIIFGSYNIQMETSTLLNYTFNLDDIAIVYGPHTFNNTQLTNFTFLINSPYGSLTEYGINITYPGGSNYITGNNAIGGSLTALVNISNATVFDVVRLEYFYDTTIGGQRNFTDQFTITFPDGTGTLTFMANKDKTFGMGIFERVLIATLIAIFIVGIASLIGQPLPGFALNMFLQSYLTYIGFIPIWITLPSLLLGMLIMVWKSGGT